MASGKSGRKLSKWERGEFIGWDGEGIGRGDRHAYVLMANSEGATIEERDGITTTDALDALADGMDAARQAIHVGFAIGYDVNMILADVPRATLRKLWKDETVEWVTRRAIYTLSWRQRKYFRVHRRTNRDPKPRGGTWWDVWPFFQSSFVGALEKYGVVSAELVRSLAKMKARRSTFRARDLPAMRAYNADELSSLVALMSALLVSLKKAGLIVRRWDGPGAVAAALLEREEFRARISAKVPEAGLDAFQHAYYGGRIECLQYGHLARRRARVIHHYDVNSAYPAAMRSLPCRAKGCGRWVHHKGGRIASVRADQFATHHVRWNFRNAPQRLYPFPWRSTKGSVYFPTQGEGWAWSPEVVAAFETGAVDFDVLESWEWRAAGKQKCKHRERPCAFIDRAYSERLAAVRRGDAAQHALKLSLNSLYGKLAQRVGARFDVDKGEWRLPPYHDLAGAGWITSTVRAMLYRAAMQHPEAVLMLATDAIYSTVPLTLPVSKGEKTLGEWDYTTHVSATIVQSGVYFLDDADGEAHLYSRGFDAETVDRRKILSAWRARRPFVIAAQERFIGLGRALASLDSWRLWRTWLREPRDVALFPWLTKRTPMLQHGKRHPGDASAGMLPTIATDTSRFWLDPFGNGMMTTPSPVPWRDLDDLDVEEIDPAQRIEEESEDAAL